MCKAILPLVRSITPQPLGAMDDIRLLADYNVSVSTMFGRHLVAMMLDRMLGDRHN
jgi:hypothetical protein